MVEDRQQQAGLIKEQSAKLSAKWPWVVLVAGVILAWAGKELDLPTTTIGYIMMGAIGLFVLQAAFDDWQARRRIIEIERNINALRFEWVASGAFTDLLASYCAKIGKEGFSGGLADSPEVHEDLQDALLNAVGAYAKAAEFPRLT
jgi:hypothetical protein